MRFTATCVTYQTQDDVAMLGFADDEFKTTRYVLLQKDLEPSQRDLELAHDTLYIEIDDQRHSRYGGVVKAQLQESRLVLKLDPQAAADMSVDDTIEISFRVPMERLKEISNQLRLLLGNDIVQVDASI